MCVWPVRRHWPLGIGVVHAARALVPATQPQNGTGHLKSGRAAPCSDTLPVKPQNFGLEREEQDEGGAALVGKDWKELGEESRCKYKLIRDVCVPR